jgi:heavy metal sensor kinase
MRLSIRWRLTLWNTLALAVVLLGFAALVYALLAGALYEQIDHKLLAGYQRLERDERLSEDRDGRIRHWIDDQWKHERVVCVVYDAQGKVHARTAEVAADSVPASPGAAPGGPHFGTLAVAALGRQRAATGRLRLGDEEFDVMLLAPLEEADHELRELLTALTLAVPAALVASVALGYLLARKALAPVERLRRSTREITAERLDRRLPVANPGDELGALAQTINEMIGRLERSFAEVRRFTADASHELRTPLTAIRTEAEVAIARSPGAAEQNQLLGSILEECERLTRLTDQLLTLSREDAGVARQVCEPVDLTALVADVVDTLRPLADSGRLELRCVSLAPAGVSGDAGRLRQVFLNVLDNAIKYTPEGGRIEVSVEAKGGDALVTVRDTGIGIPAEHLPRVFERFYRVDKARSREQGGTGLGLSISKSIVTAHGGRIELTSAPGQGTACAVTLPLADPKEGGRAEAG